MQLTFDCWKFVKIIQGSAQSLLVATPIIISHAKWTLKVLTTKQNRQKNIPLVPFGLSNCDFINNWYYSGPMLLSWNTRCNVAAILYWEVQQDDDGSSPPAQYGFLHELEFNFFLLISLHLLSIWIKLVRWGPICVELSSCRLQCSRIICLIIVCCICLIMINNKWIHQYKKI